MLIIVESPAKAKTISQIVGKKYTVKASVGHIRSLSKDKKTKDGRKLEIAGIDIENNFTPFYEIDPDKMKVVKELKQLAKAAQDGILFATDSDREGEAISWHLAKVLGIKDMSKVRRLEFHEITKKAIEKAIQDPRDIDMMLVSAQQARQVLDKLVGFKLSPVIWTVMGNRNLSAGRVQSPALALICKREKEIEAFVPEEYWEIKGEFIGEKTHTKEVWLSHSIEDNTNTEDIKDKVLYTMTAARGQKLPKVVTSKQEVLSYIKDLPLHNQFSIVSTTEKEETTRTKPPFTTSTLQQAASSKLGLSPKNTMQLAQKMYEGIAIDGQQVGLITYMRTDSVNLSEESLQKSREIISQHYPAFLPDKAKYYKTKSRNAQEAHEAIRPTDPLRTPESLKNKLDARILKLYELIWKQTIASQMTDERRTRISFTLHNDRQDEFSGSIAWTTHAGFKAVLGGDIISEPPYSVRKGDTVYLQTALYHQKFTSPPSRYSPASLIKKLEELGIGRPSTYASIISTLQERDYVEVLKNVMKPTTLGMKVGQLLGDNFSYVTSSDLTAHMEDELDAISRGEKEYHEVLLNFWKEFKKEVETKTQQLAENREKYKAVETDVKCPTCGSSMSLRIGRFGEYFQCSDHQDHLFPKNFREYKAALTQARQDFEDQAHGKKCAECGKDLIVRVSKSTLNPYIACPEYKVGNKHSVLSVHYGHCPQCEKEGRTGSNQGVLVKKKARRGDPFLACSLDPKICGYIQKIVIKSTDETDSN